MSDSAQQALRRMFAPESVVVIGLSRSAIGSPVSILTTLQDYGYTGTIYVVNPNMQTPEDGSYMVCKTILELPKGVELAIVSVAREQVLETLRDCITAGIGAAIVITQGFADADTTGADMQRQLVDLCSESGLRILGPNTIGVANAHARFTSSFIEVHHDLAPIGLVSQSGLFMMGHLLINNEPAGFSMSADLGNACDLDAADVIEYYERDENISVIACHVETIRDGPGFMETVRRVSLRKPIVVLKAGNSETGQLAVASHSGAAAGEREIYQAAFRQAGVAQAADAEEFRLFAKAFATYRPPRGNRVAVMSFSGGGAILAIDAIEDAGLKLAELSAATRDELQPLFPAWMTVTNPVDIWIGVARDFHTIFPRVLETLLNDAGVDAVLCIYCSYTLPKYAQYDSSLYIADIAEQYPHKPIVNWTYGMDIAGFTRRVEARGNTLVFRSLSEATRTLAKMNEYRRFCAAAADPAPPIRPLAADDTAAADIIQRARGNAAPYLGAESLELLDAYGIRTARALVATSETSLKTAAEELRFPLCLKIISADIVHKWDVGGVILGIETPSQLVDSYRALLDSMGAQAPRAKVDGVLVQEMIPPGKELMIGMKRDPVFGPCLIAGAGGTYTAVLGDFAFRLAPLDEHEALHMLEQLRCAPVLHGVRGEPPCFIDGVVDTLLRVSRLVCTYPEITELDINPLIVGAESAVAVDGRMRLN